VYPADQLVVRELSQVLGGQPGGAAELAADGELDNLGQLASPRVQASQASSAQGAAGAASSCVMPASVAAAAVLSLSAGCQHR